MPSLVIDARMINASGIGVYLQNIIPYLSREYKLTLLGDKKELAKFPGLSKINTIQANAPVYSFKEQLELRKQIPVCDLFWSPHYNIPLLPISARKRVVTIHDVYHLAYQHTLTLPQKVYAKVLLNAAVRLSDKVITVSEFSRTEILKYTHAREEKVSTIYNGIDTNKFYQQSTAKSSFLDDMLFGPTDSRFILFVGNIKPHKNLVTLLKAFGLLIEQDPNYNLVIVGKKEGFITGDNQIADLLNEQVQLKEKVIFTGYIEDEYLARLYQKASVFVFPSVYEGFGMPPLEAMACGCPVIASEAASIPEICGNAAAYFETLDPFSLAETLKKVLNSEEVRAKLIANGLERVKAFTWDRAAKEHLNVFRQLTNS